MIRRVAVLLGLWAGAGWAEPLDQFQDCDVCPVMIELPMGEFVMGAAPDEFRRMFYGSPSSYSGDPENPYLKTDEGPQHTVVMDMRIAMGRDEVTHDQWMACVEDGGCDWTPRLELLRQGPGPIERVWAGGNHPANRISYLRALQYVDWLNEVTESDGYRLPTEAEWEYAARAGTQTPYYQGDTLTSAQANFSGQFTDFMMLRPRTPELLERGLPVPVDTLDAANAWGLRHMSGNMNEITMSCYIRNYVGWGTASEWLAESAGESCTRAHRGGSYFGPMDVSRVAWRGPVDEDVASDSSGLRVVKELE